MARFLFLLLTVLFLSGPAKADNHNSPAFVAIPKGALSETELEIPSHYLGQWQDGQCWNHLLGKDNHGAYFLTGNNYCGYKKPDMKTPKNWTGFKRLHIFAMGEGYIWALSRSVLNDKEIKSGSATYDYLQIKYEPPDKLFDVYRLEITSGGCKRQNLAKNESLKDFFIDCIPSNNVIIPTGGIFTYFQIPYKRP